MQKTSRRKRPPIERTEPDRSFSGWVGAGAPRSKRRNTEARSAEGAKGSGPNEGRERSYQAINGAYRLIDEYLRQGQKMAEELWLPSETSGRGDGPFEAPMRFMRAMGDMTMAWVEVMQQWTEDPATPATRPLRPFSAGKPVPPRADDPPAPAARAESMQALRVAVKATVPVEVSVNVADSSDLADLVASELRPFAGDAPPIRTVSVETGARGEAPVLRIVVPKGVPSGTYSGLLVARGTHRPCGTISLVVS